MSLFVEMLDREVEELHAKAVRLRIIGNRQRLSVRLQQRIAAAELRTAGNTGLRLQVAVSYGGRWDIVEAARAIARDCASGALRADEIDEDMLGERMQLAGLPDPDLFIRTGGEVRVSNFLLWNIAYAELHFSDVLWPDFQVKELEAALGDFDRRQRRFGAVQTQGTPGQRT